MDPSYSVDDYRNFAENKGIFGINATNIAIYDKNGVQTGVIERMMNFDGVADVWWGNASEGTAASRSGEHSLVGGPSFLAGVAHDFVPGHVSFVKRFGGTGGTAYADEYKIINYQQGDETIKPANGDLGGNGSRDSRVSRLSKIVTEASWTDYYTGDASRLVNAIVQRAGGGEQHVATGGSTTDEVNTAYMWLTGGQLKLSSVSVDKANLDKLGQGPAWEYDSLKFSSGYGKSEGIPMRNPSTAGDSGSGVWWYDSEAGKWWYLGATSTGSVKPGESATSGFVGTNQWAVAYIDGYNQALATNTSETILWKAGTESADGKPGSTAESTLTIGGQTVAYTTLADGLRGDTSAQGFRADDASLDACNNLILTGTGNNVIELQDSIDTGAGYLEFRTSFTLQASSAGNRLNTAGWVVDSGAVVTSRLTGAAGDEWRMVGEGIVRVEGSGQNNADLNIGGTLLVELNRTDGYAARNIKINAGGAVVRLMGGGDQIGGNIVFGHRGGVLDLYGHNLSNDQAFVRFETGASLPGGNYIAAMDEGACIANMKDGSVSTFTYTSTASSTFVGQFADDAARGAFLNVVYDGGSGAWTLTGVQRNAGTWDVKSGNLIIAGELADFHGNTDSYVTAVLASGAVTVEDGAMLTAGAHGRIDSALNVAGTLRLNGQGLIAGGVALSGAGSIDAAIDSGSGIIQGLVSGAGGIVKSGSGTLVLENAGNSFNGASSIAGGVVQASAASALGQALWTVQQNGTLLVDASAWGDYKARVQSLSTGTIGLQGDIADASMIDMNGLASMSLGAVGSASIGNQGSGGTLRGWTADGGYRFGGGGGELTINAKLTGSGAMTIGGNGKNGVVILSGDNSGYAGAITLLGGTGLVMNGTNLISQISNSSSGTLLIRGNVADNYNFAGKTNLRFGTDSTATYSGRLSGGSYLFGGSGTMRLTSAISGSAMIESGTHIWLNTANAIGGTINVKSGAVLQIGEGNTGGSIGTGNVVMESQGSLVFNSDANMTIDTKISGQGSVEKRGQGTAVLTTNCTYLATTAVWEGTLQLGNGGTTGSVRNQIDLHHGTTLTINREDDVVMNNYIRGVDGAARVVKTGEGSLTLTNWQNSYTGGTVVKKGELIIGQDEEAGYGVIGSGAVSLEGGRLNVNNKVMTNAIYATAEGSSLVGYSKYAGTVTATANLVMQGGLSAGSTQLLVQNNSVITLLQGLRETTTLKSIDFSKGSLTFALNGAWDELAIGESRSYTLLTALDTMTAGDLAALSWMGNPLAAGYVTEWSLVDNSLMLTLSNQIPEPGAAVLALAGLAGLLVRRRRGDD